MHHHLRVGRVGLVFVVWAFDEPLDIFFVDVESAPDFSGLQFVVVDRTSNNVWADGFVDCSSRFFDGQETATPAH